MKSLETCLVFIEHISTTMVAMIIVHLFYDDGRHIGGTHLKDHLFYIIFDIIHYNIKSLKAIVIILGNHVKL